MYGGQERQETETRATDISTRERGERGQVKRKTDGRRDRGAAAAGTGCKKVGSMGNGW